MSFVLFDERVGYKDRQVLVNVDNISIFSKSKVSGIVYVDMIDGSRLMVKADFASLKSKIKRGADHERRAK